MITISDITTAPSLSYRPVILKYFEPLIYAMLSPSSVTNHVFPVPGIYFQTKKSLTQVSKLSSTETSFDHALLLFSWIFLLYAHTEACAVYLHQSTYYTAQWLFDHMLLKAGTLSHSSIHLIHPQHRAQY